MEEKEKRKRIILLVVGIVTLMTLIIGATFAYFQAQADIDGNIEAGATTGTIDQLEFNISDIDVVSDINKIKDDNKGSEIIINANQINFEPEGNSLGDGVNLNAHLIAGSSGIASYTYNVYLDIAKNDLEYSSYKYNDNVKYFKTKEEKEEAKSKGIEIDSDNVKLDDLTPIPELVLIVQKPGGGYLDSIGTLSKSEITIEGESVPCFDITEAKDLITITSEYLIETEEASSEIEQDWKVSVIFKNLDTDQQLNTGKSFSAKVIIQKDEMKKPIQDKLLVDANKDTTTLYFHNTELEGGAEDDSYRYAGSSEEVKNYVCLDGGATSEGQCGSDDSDLYRIIGLFKNDDGKYEIKLIKSDYATSTQLGEEGAYEKTYNNDDGYYWSSRNGADNNEWINSELRKTNLNDYYLNTYLKGQKHIDVDNLITTHTWSLYGIVYEYYPPKDTFNMEINDIQIDEVDYPSQIKEVPNKIGLMYVSDYGYAASPNSTSNWTTTLDEYNTNNIPENNWMYMGYPEWTISRISSSSIMIPYIESDGYVCGIACGVGYSGNLMNVRPTFYLSSDAQIKSGDGSKGSPYRLVL